MCRPGGHGKSCQPFRSKWRTKNMNLSMRTLLKRILLYSLPTILFHAPASGQNSLSVHWGLEGGLRAETRATRRQNAADWPKAGPNEKLYRYFKLVNEESTMTEMIRRHFSVWREYK